MGKSLKLRSALIMLIDDTPQDLFVSRRIIEKYGINTCIITFSWAIHAIEYLQQHQNDSQKIPEIIICDMHMPHMNGYDFLEAYDKLPQHIKLMSKVYILSTNTEADDIKKLNANPNVIQFYKKHLTEAVVGEILNKSQPQ